MSISSERCTIRDFRPEDIDRFMEYRNNMEWMRYQGYKGKSREVYETDLLQDAPIETGKQLALINTATSQLIGDVYLRKEDDVFWLGYTVHPAHARKGYAAEAVVAMIGWIAEQNGSMIKAGVLPDNIASIGLLKKLGFLHAYDEEGELVFSYDLRTNKATSE